MNDEMMDKFLKKENVNKEIIKKYLAELLKDTNEVGWLTTTNWCGYSIDEAYRPNVECKLNQNENMISNISEKVIGINDEIKSLAFSDNKNSNKKGRALSSKKIKSVFGKYFKDTKFPWFKCDIDGLSIKANFKTIIEIRLRRIAKLYEIGCPKIIINNELYDLAQSILVNEYSTSVLIYYPNEIQGEE